MKYKQSYKLLKINRKEYKKFRLRNMHNMLSHNGDESDSKKKRQYIVPTTDVLIRSSCQHANHQTLPAHSLNSQQATTKIKQKNVSSHSAWHKPVYLTHVFILGHWKRLPLVVLSSSIRDIGICIQLLHVAIEIWNRNCQKWSYNKKRKLPLLQFSF